MDLCILEHLIQIEIIKQLLNEFDVLLSVMPRLCTQAQVVGALELNVASDAFEPIWYALEQSGHVLKPFEVCSSLSSCAKCLIESCNGF
jgi:hypothetical protein